MLNHEIENIVVNFLNGLRARDSFIRLIRELDTDRSNLRSSHEPEESEELARTVITKLATLKRRLIRSTSLRQESDLETAIELATAAVIERDHNIRTDFQENYQLSD